MPLRLQTPPGYSDLSDSVLVADSPALGLDLAKISDNAAFGLTRPEIFLSGPYQHGDVVPLPVSPIDGYSYNRSELFYVWSIQNTVEKASGWITGKDSLWWMAYLVDQQTGQVFIDEAYRRSGSHPTPSVTHDGTLTVWTVAQRQRTNLIMATSPSYSAISSGWIGLDEPFSQQLAQGMNDDAKFSVVGKEAFYLGEYYDGQTVSLPVSPCDGYGYTAAECAFMFSWRWTPDGTLPLVQNPPFSFGQLGPIKASVSGSGVVSITVEYIDDNGTLSARALNGRIAVFAFCTRATGPASISPVANAFAQLSTTLFLPGSTLRTATVQQMVDNIMEALLSVEYFGPTTHHNGDTILPPVSPVDGYQYSISECTFVWSFSDTTMASGSNLRMASFGGAIDQNSGVVQLYGYRLPPGGGYVGEDTTKPTISVIIVARRGALPATSIAASATQPQADSTVGGNLVTDVPTVSSIGILPAGPAPNGSNTSFTFSTSPAATILCIFWNGQMRFDFTQTSPPSTAFTTAFTPETGDTLYVLFYT